MPLETHSTLPIETERDIVVARQEVRRLCQELLFTLVEQTKMVTAASELARNVLVHAGGGAMHWEKIKQGGRLGLRLRFEDTGPGIANLELAMKDGWSSGGGLGMGLGGTKRLVNDFSIESEPRVGTKVVIVRWK